MKRETGISLPNNQRQHRTKFAEKPFSCQGAIAPRQENGFSVKPSDPQVHPCTPGEWRARFRSRPPRTEGDGARGIFLAGSRGKEKGCSLAFLVLKQDAKVDKSTWQELTISGIKEAVFLAQDPFLGKSN